MLSMRLAFPILGVLCGIFFQFQLKILKANSEDPDQTPRDLVLHCLPMSLKKKARLIWVNKA